MNKISILASKTLFILTVITVSFIIVPSAVFGTDTTRNIENKVSLPSRILDSIEIGSNNDFDSDLWCGAGTESDPWILDEHEFSHMRNGITISDIDAFFRIKSCTFSNLEDHGIYITNTSNGMICENTFSNNGVGVIIKNSQDTISENITFCNNEFTGNGRTIIVERGTNIAIESNNIFLNDNAIFFEDSLRVKITYNHISNNNYSIGLDNTVNSIIIQNTFTNNTNYAVQLVSSTCNVTQNNFIYNNLFGTSHGYDDTFNKWDENYWSDLGGSSTYIIDGPANNEDFNPSSSSIAIGSGCQESCDGCASSSFELITGVIALATMATALVIVRKRKRQQN